MELSTRIEGMRSEDGFPTPVAAKLGGVSSKVLENWRSRGFIEPSVAGRAPKPSIYSFRDIIAIRVAANLSTQGIELGRLKRVVDYLRRRKGLSMSASDVLASTLLISDGHDVYEVSDAEAFVGISTLRDPDQLVVLVPFGRLVAQVQADARKLRAA